MPQKIDVHGLFIDPETITDLMLQKRISVYYPVFHEVARTKSLFQRTDSSQLRILQFDRQEPYGIILADVEQPDSASYAVTYHQALIDKIFKSVSMTGKNLIGHINELLKIEISGDRQYRILQSGRNVKQTSIREIPAKVRLLSGQWVDVFKSSPGYDFQGGTPYAVTDVGAAALMIVTKDKNYVLFGAGVDATNEDVISAYRSLAILYNEIQERRDAAIEENAKKPWIQMPQINIQLLNVELPKIEMPQIKFQLPFVLGKKQEKPAPKALPEAGSDDLSTDDK
ncbi:MAG: hypothetical protein GX246_09970 [Clostridiales bacterium]|nr:hypothetical protein [Bacillota bacterium]NLL55461.1 hypothetical protein [Clostridiales bacterium]